MLRLRVGNGLPLHIGWRISPVTNEGDNVVDHVALARTFTCTSGRAWVLLFECGLGRVVAFDTGVGNLARQCQHHGK